MTSVFHNRYAWLAAGVLVSCVTLAQSDKPFAAPKESVAAAAPGAASLVQVTFSLLLVLAAVFAAAWVVRRLRNIGRLGADAITVIADVGLGPKERAVLVQVGGKQLLLGVAPGRVSTLHVLDEPVTNVAAVVTSMPDAANQGPATPDFKAILKRSLGMK